MRPIDADELIQHSYSAVIDGVETDIIDVSNVDNAQTVTVEPETKIVANVTFDKEQLKELVEKAKNDILAQIERPQGEWIFNSDSLTDDMIATHYCSICGKGAYSGHDNYCWNCGAEMKPKTCTNCETFGQYCGDCEVGEDD